MVNGILLYNTYTIMFNNIIPLLYGIYIYTNGILLLWSMVYYNLQLIVFFD